MWPLYHLIRILRILKYCEISWDLLKYFHLKSNAVYNSSAKNTSFQDPKAGTGPGLVFAYFTHTTLLCYIWNNLGTFFCHPPLAPKQILYQLVKEMSIVVFSVFFTPGIGNICVFHSFFVNLFLTESSARNFPIGSNRYYLGSRILKLCITFMDSLIITLTFCSILNIKLI